MANAAIACDRLEIESVSCDQKEIESDRGELASECTPDTGTRTDDQGTRPTFLEGLRH